ncbi:MAG: hypothetical protein GY778_04780, partial [bacterium]|nr:hypothetical protein [bacterium]
MLHKLLDVIRENPVPVFAGMGLVVLWIWWRRRKRRRSRRPAQLNPKLQKYQYGDTEELIEARRREAAKILATSSSAHIVGYDIVQQIEAVYVDGFRRPEKALEGLKAAAAMKGANAVINVHTDRSSAGRCAASGDAIL